MRDISISIDVFAAIWALREPGEQSENDILQRVVAEYSSLKGLDEVVSKPESERKDISEESTQPEEIFRVPKEVKGSKRTPVEKLLIGDSDMGKIRWVDDVRAALRKLGGSASLHSIYREVESRRREGNRSVPRTLDATVRRTLEDHSSDSKNFRGVDLFTNVGRGEWALRDSVKY